MNSQISVNNISNQKPEAHSQIVAILKEFNEDEWVIYLQKLCYDLNPKPTLRAFSPELIEQLFWIYNTLNKNDKESRMLFSKSLLHFLRTIAPQPSDNKLIYDLIYFIHEIRPIEQRRLLEVIIKDESFKSLNFGSDNLHLLLIKSYIFIEDSQNLYIEEYLRNLVDVNSPYSLYVIVFYYTYLGRENQALDFLFKFISESKWNKNEVLCEEIYNILTDCVPQYITLFKFLQRFIEDNIKINYSNIHLSKCIDEFIIDLKTVTENRGLTLFAEDVLKSETENIRKSGDIIESVEKEELNTLIIKYVVREYEINVNKEIDEEDKKPVEIAQLVTETIEESNYFTAGVRTF